MTDNDPDITVRKLAADDALQLRNMRLFALKDSPTAFTSSYEEELERFNDGDYVNAIQTNHYFGAFHEDTLIGIMGYFVRPHRKQWHQGVLFGVFVHPDWRGNAISQRMLELLIADAHKRVEMMVLQVAVDNFSARHTYLKAGFQSYGVEPKALKVGDAYIDEEHMWLDLKSHTH